MKKRFFLIKSLPVVLGLLATPAFAKGILNQVITMLNP
jgi:hypothetical protein